MKQRFAQSRPAVVNDAAFEDRRMRPPLVIFNYVVEQLSRVSIRLLFGSMLMLLAPGALHADTFTVDNQGDGAASCKTPKNCTLRAALSASEADAGQSTIYLPKGSYKLARALPAIRTAVTIVGAGPEATVVWGPCTTDVREKSTGHCVPFVDEYRVFAIATGSLVLSDMTIRGGAGPDGAGILNQGTVRLEHVTVMGNNAHLGAGGISNLSGGHLSLNNSTVRENYSHHGAGGGIVNEANGRVDITNSTISGNQVVVGDGGSPGGNAGGIVNRGLIAITASTISGNWGATSFTDRAGNAPGGILNLGEAWLNGVSIAANNGGWSSGTAAGVQNLGQFYFGNTIIAGNNGDDCIGELTSLRGNLVGKPGYMQNGKYPCNLKDWTGLPATTPVKPADIVGERQGVPLHWNVFVAPGVGEFRYQNSGTPLLGNNGGPTCTQALCTLDTCFNNVNWARNKGWQNVPSTFPLACSASDQRGAARNSCDSGAFETVIASPPLRPELGDCSPTIILK